MPFIRPALTFATIAIVFSVFVGAWFYVPMMIVHSTFNTTIIASR